MLGSTGCAARPAAAVGYQIREITTSLADDLDRADNNSVTTGVVAAILPAFLRNSRRCASRRSASSRVSVFFGSSTIEWSPYVFASLSVLSLVAV